MLLFFLNYTGTEIKNLIQIKKKKTPQKIPKLSGYFKSFRYLFFDQHSKHKKWASVR